MNRGRSCSEPARDRRSRRSTRPPHRSAALPRRVRASASAGALQPLSDREPARRPAFRCRRRCESPDAPRTTDTARTRLAPRRDGARARGGIPDRRPAAVPRTESGCASTARLATAAVALAAETVMARQTPRRRHDWRGRPAGAGAASGNSSGGATRGFAANLPRRGRRGRRACRRRAERTSPAAPDPRRAPAAAGSRSRCRRRCGRPRW